MGVKDVLDMDRFYFRGLHPKIALGTASDRYAGWIGQIYCREDYRNRLIRRSHKVGGKSFSEEVLPVESIREYFEHFRVLEIDFTFYQTLLDRDGKPTQAYRTLRAYGDHLEGDDSLILKVPQSIFARKIRRGHQYEAGESFLDPDLFTHLFYQPAVDMLGKHIRGFVFEQEYHRREERMRPEELAEHIDSFFSLIPEDIRYHIEWRTESYLHPAVFQAMATHGVGQVLSHWTWLPPLITQFEKAGKSFFNGGNQVVIRLMTPRGTRYEDAYAQAFPFDRLVPGMLQPQMVKDTVEIMRQAVEQGVYLNVIINNRSGGNAPSIARLIAAQFMNL